MVKKTPDYAFTVHTPPISVQACRTNYALFYTAYAAMAAWSLEWFYAGPLPTTTTTTLLYFRLSFVLCYVRCIFLILNDVCLLPEYFSQVMKVAGSVQGPRFDEVTNQIQEWRKQTGAPDGSIEG
jgi:hypothetical protein